MNLSNNTINVIFTKYGKNESQKLWQKLSAH